MTHASLLDVFRNSAVIYAFKGGFQFCCTHARNSSKHSEWKLGVVMVINIGGNIAGRVPKSGVSKHFRCLKEVRLFPKI